MVVGIDCKGTRGSFLVLEMFYIRGWQIFVFKGPDMGCLASKEHDLQKDVKEV